LSGIYPVEGVARCAQFAQLAACCSSFGDSDDTDSVDKVHAQGEKTLVQGRRCVIGFEYLGLLRNLRDEPVAMTDMSGFGSSRSRW